MSVSPVGAPGILTGNAIGDPELWQHSKQFYNSGGVSVVIDLSGVPCILMPDATPCRPTATHTKPPQPCLTREVMALFSTRLAEHLDAMLLGQ